jgi:hypothetical protein
LTNRSTSPAVQPIGWVHSPLQRRADAPRQGHEGTPNARLQIEASFLPGLDGIRAAQGLAHRLVQAAGRRFGRPDQWEFETTVAAAIADLPATRSPWPT